MPADSDELNWTKFVRFAALDLPAPPLKNSEVERVWRIYQSNIDRLTAMMESWSRSFEQDSAKVKWTAARVGPLQFRARGVTEGWRSPTGDTSCARRKFMPPPRGAMG